MLFNKLNTTKSTGKLDRLLTLLNPMLKMTGVNIDTVITDSAAKVHKTLEQINKKIFITIQIAETGDHYILSIVEIPNTDNSTYKILGVYKITSIPDLINAFNSFTNNLENLTDNEYRLQQAATNEPSTTEPSTTGTGTTEPSTTGPSTDATTE